ncbi:DUF2280 domain-containing protein [Sphingobium yanoikuyae]|uniref:DUF2280 domain-containing protein n=1 Tax=Sphingobium yanoikuyae TaxID=13690 RepID=UPI0035C73B2D
MADFSNEQKRFIVVALAQFRQPAEVVALFREEFEDDAGINVRRVIGYDPTRPSYNSGPEWIELFEATRAAYVTDVSAIPIANQAFRLNQLQRMAADAIKAGNRGQAAALMKQAAEEIGGAYTNERNVKVEQTKGGFRDLQPEERRQAIGDMIREAMGKDAAQNAPSSGATQ